MVGAAFETVTLDGSFVRSQAFIFIRSPLSFKSRMILEVNDMMYPYMILADETEVVHSQIIEEDSKQKIIVNFERPTEDGFDSARCELPDYHWIEKNGY